MNPIPDLEARIAGCLIGGAVGDALGLPFEGLSPARIGRILRPPVRHQFVWGRGMVSDDTDHAIFAAQALAVSRGDREAFRTALAWRLRWWLACFPAGVGWGTLRALIRLWCGSRNPGVASAGNGPAMRSAILGVALAHDPDRRAALVNCSSQLTHTDPRAIAASRAVAEIAARITNGEWKEPPPIAELARMMHGISADPDWARCVDRIANLDRKGVAHAAFAAACATTRGISGYALHSVPFAILLWHSFSRNYARGIEAAIRAGGDTDTVAAIAGGLIGAGTGVEGIPPEWVAGLVDRPHGVRRMHRLAKVLAGGEDRTAVRFSPWLFPRGIVFTALVLLHGFRRLLPPY